MFLDEIKVGEKIKIAPAVVEEEEMLAFSRRFNNIPIHTDKDYAKTTKFGKPIASGIMSFLIVWANYVQMDFAGEQLIAGKSSKIDWFKPVFAGDVLTGTAEVTAITPRNEYNGVLEVTIDVFNQSGELVLKNVTESIVKRK
ncbi:MAG: MaoC family dehydratase [Oscillospiraceae bacterium]